MEEEEKQRRSVLLDLLAGTPVRRNCSSFFAQSANFGPWIPARASTSLSSSSAKRKVTVHSFFIISFDEPYFLVSMCVSRINLRDKVENGSSLFSSSFVGLEFCVTQSIDQRFIFFLLKTRSMERMYVENASRSRNIFLALHYIYISKIQRHHLSNNVPSRAHSS